MKLVDQVLNRAALETGATVGPSGLVLVGRRDGKLTAWVPASEKRLPVAARSTGSGTTILIANRRGRG